MIAKPPNGGKLAPLYPAGKLATAQPAAQPRYRRSEHVAQHVLGRLNNFHGSKGFAATTFGDFDFDEPKFMPQNGLNLASNVDDANAPMGDDFVDDFADIEMPSS